MVSNIPLLDEVKVAAPCPKRWEDMIGGDRVRFCRDCSKNVYNLSEMTKVEAEQLLQTHEGRLCVQFYRRSDGKILTQNCPVGLRAIRRTFLKQAVKVSTLYTAIFGTSCAILLPMFSRTGGERMGPDSLKRDIKRREQEVADKKRKLNNKKHPSSVSEREELEEYIESQNRSIVAERKFLQSREAERNLPKR